MCRLLPGHRLCLTGGLGARAVECDRPLKGSLITVADRNTVVITPYRDGPLLIRGPVALLDSAGRPIANQRAPVALCRCGKSRIKPFCDGTHKLIGFQAPPLGAATSGPGSSD